MGTITVRVSDLSGQQLDDETQAARLIVEHPDFAEPVGLDVLREEVEPQLTEDRTRFVVVSLMSPGDTDTTRYVLLMDEFENLFQDGDSTTVLEAAYEQQQQQEQAPVARRGRRQAAAGTRQRINWASPEHAGTPHPGTISEAEKAYVREHLDEVNERLRRERRREIDPNNSVHAERYGLTPQPAVEPEIEEAEVVEEQTADEQP